MNKENIPCCAAEAMWRVRQFGVGGIVGGLAMPETIHEVVNGMNKCGTSMNGDELMKCIKLYNYVMKAAEEAYRTALFRECKNKE